MAIPKLTEVQKERLRRLEPKLQKAASEGDLQTAKSITLDLQQILRPTGHETRLMQIKNWLYEAGIEAGNYDFSIEGLKAVRLKTNNNTRLHLEATTLLAIAFLRKNELLNAEPFIKEVLQNDKVIKSETKRILFRKSIIERFDEEVTLFSMKGIGNDNLNIEEVQNEALVLSERNSEQEIYNTIGNAVPEAVIKSIFNIDDFAKKQLPTGERLKLPSPNQQIKSDQVGKTLFSSIKRTLYKSLCDPESDVYKSWFNDGIKIVLSKKFISYAVVGLLTGLGIGIKMIATSVTALILKFGIEVYCNHYKPTAIMELR